MAAVQEEIRGAAVRAVKIGLCLRQLALEQHITVEESEITQQMQEYLRRGASLSQAKHTEKPAKLQERIAYWLRNQKTLERLDELASVTPLAGSARPPASSGQKTSGITSGAVV